jgi:hypothetical protein
LIAVSLVLLLGAFAQAATAKSRAKATTTIATSTAVLSQADGTQRIEALCPSRMSPYGGGMTADPPPAADGEGAYPHISERIGFQHGWHVTPVLFDAAAPTTPRNVTVQAVCGPDPGKVAAVRIPAPQVNPGQVQTAVATCPAGRHLIAGGFQQTDFTSKGGDFATQSQAIGNNAWSVTGSAFGSFGGQLFAVAYCVKGKSSWQEVSAAAGIAPGATATATTPACPPGKRLVDGGFNTSPAGSVFASNIALNPDQSFTASGYNRSTAPATITGYAYCLTPTVAKPHKKKKK